jgi:hypothetical protein
MALILESYLEQLELWPRDGRHILAQFDDQSVIVYQAYRPDIGHFVAKHGHFGGQFSFNRISWIKPNFLSMMFRSDWGTKVDQEITLAIKLKRAVFDEILRLAVHSSFIPEIYGTEDEWKNAVARSNVRLQWDTDPDPSGANQERRAVQLGLRADVLRLFGKEWLLGIEDVSDYVTEQRVFANSREYEKLQTPSERLYPIHDAKVAAKLGANEPSEETVG